MWQSEKLTWKIWTHEDFLQNMKNFGGKVSKFRWKSEEYIWQSKEFIWKQWKNEDLNGTMTNRCEKVSLDGKVR